MPKFKDDPNKTFKDFWESIVGPEDNLNTAQVKLELHDFACLIENATKVYYHITGGMISKAQTDPDAVISEADQTTNNAINDALEEHEDYLKSWEHESLHVNSLLIFFLDPDTPKDERNKLSKKAKQIISNHRGATCILLPKGTTTLQSVTEEQMNLLGWFKKK